MDTSKDQPEPGKVYALTGGPDDQCILNGDSWAQSEVRPDGLTQLEIDLAKDDAREDYKRRAVKHVHES